MKYTGLEIAIIGLDGKFPGAKNVHVLWENLSNGVESISRFTDEELANSYVSEELMQNPNYIRAKGIIENPEYFDPTFFGYTRTESRLMDPQIRLLHECAWHALEDAGYDPFRYDKRIGIYAGATSNPLWHAAALRTEFEGLAQIVADKDYICTRIANSLNLTGPAVFLQTACSTSLVSVHVACRALLTGDCEMALAGGIGLSIPNKVGYLYQEGMINSSDGHCRPFDKKADGMVGGEGYGLVVLKPLKKAIADRDNIHAVILSSAINNDGNDKLSFAAPSVKGQSTAIRLAHKLGAIDPNTIGYVEAHGTGTYIGDPIEVQALTAAFATSKKQFCALGSIKSNLGHLDHAAGIAGLIKAVLCLKYKRIPPTLHFNTPNPELKLEASPFYVNNAVIEWAETTAHPRRAGVNSLGIGGTNAYVILEESPEIPSAAKTPDEFSIVLTSARTLSSLNAAQKLIANHIALNKDQISLADLTYTLASGRAQFAHRSAFICKSLVDAQQHLLTDPGMPQKAAIYNNCSDLSPNIIFMFPGQGTQYLNMTRELYEKNSIYRDLLNDCFSRLGRLGMDAPEQYLFGEQGTTILQSNTAIAQPILFSVEYALAQLLITYGVTPSACIGHSLGEFVAACISNIINLDEALFIVSERGKLMQSIDSGQMISVALSADETTEYLDDSITIAAINGTRSTVVSGNTVAFRKKLDLLGIRYVVVNATHAFHSHMVEPIIQRFTNLLSKLDIRSPTIPMISNLTGDWINDTDLSDHAFWAKHMREPVLFMQGIETLKKMENPVFIEVGPGNVLSRIVKQFRGKTSAAVISICNSQDNAQSDVFVFIHAIAQMWSMGINPKWEKLFENYVVRKISVPGYVFDHERFGFDIIGSMLSLPSSNDIEAVNIQYSLSNNAHEIITEKSAILYNSLSHTEASNNVILRVIYEIYSSTLGVDDIDIDSDFFALGGDSYTAMIAIAKIHKITGVRVSLSDFFNTASITSLTSLITHAKKSIFMEIPRTQVMDRYPLSPAQLRFFIVQQTEFNNTGYNESFETKIVGKLDVTKLEHAFRILIERHESLRTSFDIYENEVVQNIDISPLFNIELYRCREVELDARIKDFIRPFNLACSPLFRVGLWTLDEQRHVLVIDFHHIIIDGVSMGVILDELIAVYDNQTLELIPLDYKDFSVWQNTEDFRKYVSSQEQYWVEIFRTSLSPVLDLPSDYTRSSSRSFEGGSVFRFLDNTETSEIRSFISTEGVSLFMYLVTVLSVLLHKLTGNEDISIGTVVSGRSHSSLEKVVGVFVNMLILRCYPQRMISFKEHLAAIKKSSLEAFENQEYQYEELVKSLKLPRDPARNALFDVAFVLQNTGEAKDEVKMGELTLLPYVRDKGVAKFDLTLTVVETELNGFQIKWDYSTKLFSKDTIEYFSKVFLDIARSACQQSEVKLELLNNQKPLRIHEDELLDLEDWQFSPN